MIVDDSAVVRGLISRMVDGEANFKVVASVGNGQMAVSNLQRNPVDVIILDIEMPVMDGLTAIPKLLEVDPEVKIVMASTLTVHNAEISMKCLAAGACDTIAKPSSSREISGGVDFRDLLLQKVRSLGEARKKAGNRRGGGTAPARRVPFSRPGTTPASGTPASSPSPKPSLLSPTEPVKVRQPGRQKPEILAIGSSTGGPQALFVFLKALDKNIRVPIVITQHMPKTFTTILADHINRMTGWPCEEATDGMSLQPGRIALAPGDYHMTIEGSAASKTLRLNQDPPENFCRPAVDPMLRSVVNVYGGKAAVVILTGMGSDGCKGASKIVEAGGTVVAQDEETSVVWGMPGAVAQAGLCSAVLALDDLAPYVNRLLGRGVA
ncbi:MAG: protein-glutamate methylesterase/protein-glutamine glutaminase [Magnetovibrionaceae bacterium]